MTSTNLKMENISTKDYTEQQISVNAQYPLKGTLTTPNNARGKLPAVLIIAGSGPIDRNGSTKKMDLNAYAQLADMVARLGFITLRFDKRGVGESDGDFYQTGLWDLVKDIQAMVAYLEEHPAVDSGKIILMGHSEGCMLAEIVNARHPAAGMILLSGAAETLEQASARQRELAIKELMQAKGFQGALFRLLKADKLARKQNAKLMEHILISTKDVMRVNLVRMNAKWMREHYSYHVIEDLKKSACPVLAVTGSRDVQADPEKIKKVPELVQGKGEYRIIENMDHSLKEYDGPLSVLNIMKQYKASASRPLHQELKRVITGWLVDNYK